MVAKKKTAKVKSGPGRALLPLTIKKFIDDYIYRIDLDADYQREKIWSRDEQLKLLDSIVKNIDIPKMYLAKIAGNENFDFECIDGKQRMSTLLSFLKPEPEERPLTVSIAGENYTYKRLRKELKPLADKIDNYELTFVVYEDHGDEDFLREIFRRLQLGVRLNAGELLKTYTGTIRDFVYKEMGPNPPFLSRTKLSEKRFSRPFTLAQICINSFSRNETGEFVRARYDDLAEFFEQNENLNPKDENLRRIKTVLNLMDRQFEDKAQAISSRAVAVSVYLFVEELHGHKKTSDIKEFPTFFVAFLDEIKRNLNLLTKYENPENRLVLEQFQKYISQASVEPYAIRRRHEFLKRAFNYYRSPKGKGKIIRGG
jgi:hypothetical protein